MTTDDNLPVNCKIGTFSTDCVVYMYPVLLISPNKNGSKISNVHHGKSVVLEMYSFLSLILFKV